MQLSRTQFCGTPPLCPSYSTPNLSSVLGQSGGPRPAMDRRNGSQWGSEHTLWKSSYSLSRHGVPISSQMSLLRNNTHLLPYSILSWQIQHAVGKPIGHSPAMTIHSRHLLAPLFSSTSLLDGVSIIRNICFSNAATHCFPWAMVPDMLGKLPGQLRSLTSSIQQSDVVEIDAFCQQSELTKNTFFNTLWNFLNRCGANSFSTILSLFTRLLSTWKTHNVS